MDWWEVNAEGMYFNGDTELKLNMLAYFKYCNHRPELKFQKERVCISYQFVFGNPADELFDLLHDRERDIQTRNGSYVHRGRSGSLVCRKTKKPLDFDCVLPSVDSSTGS